MCTSDLICVCTSDVPADYIIASRGVGGLRPIFGTRSHNTVVKRANSIIRYTHWFLKNRFSVNPFPISNTDLEDYLEALQFEGASPSAANSFIESIRFCDKVLNIQGLSDTISPKALNLSELATVRESCQEESAPQGEGRGEGVGPPLGKSYDDIGWLPS